MDGMVQKTVAHRRLMNLSRLGVRDAEHMVATVTIGLVSKVNVQANNIVHQIIFKFLNVCF